MPESPHSNNAHGQVFDLGPAIKDAAARPGGPQSLAEFLDDNPDLTVGASLDVKQGVIVAHVGYPARRGDGRTAWYVLAVPIAEVHRFGGDDLFSGTLRAMENTFHVRVDEHTIRTGPNITGGFAAGRRRVAHTYSIPDDVDN